MKQVKDFIILVAIKNKTAHMLRLILTFIVCRFSDDVAKCKTDRYTLE